jgi:hypothetical protein
MCALGNNGRVYFKAELDFTLTKGLAMLQVRGFHEGVREGVPYGGGV